MPLRTVIVMTGSLVVAGFATGDQSLPRRNSGKTQESSAVRDAVASRVVKSRPWQYVVVHHSATEQGSVEAIDANHRKRVDSNGVPWRGIGYHFVIGNGHGMQDGEVSSTFRWTKQIEGAHAGSRLYNDVGIGICLIGNFEVAPPTAMQAASLEELISKLQQDYDLTSSDIVAHGDIRATACPGKLFPREQFLIAAHQTARRIDSHQFATEPQVAREPSCEPALHRRVLQTAETSSDRKDSR